MKCDEITRVMQPPRVCDSTPSYAYGNTLTYLCPLYVRAYMRTYERCTCILIRVLRMYDMTPSYVMYSSVPHLPPYVYRAAVMHSIS